MQVSAKGIILLKQLSTDEAAKISKFATLIQKNAGDAILIEDEEVPGIFTIIDGNVDVFVNNTHHITTLSAGESFGEMAYLENSLASATLRAKEKDTKLVLFTKDSLSQITEQEPAISIKIHKGIAVSLSKKLRTSNQKVSSALDQIKTEVDVIGFKTSLSKNYEKLKQSSRQVGESFREIEFMINKNELDLDAINVAFKTAGDELEELFDRISVLGKGVTQLDETAKRLNEVREFFFGKGSEKGL